MKIKCDYCGNTYEDTLAQCPHCGAPNGSRHKNDKKPRTIEQLQEWYKARNLPPYETTRFFIGINHEGPRAFGIYKDDNGDVVVYKNKDNGERAIRYQGGDEEYAVNELYQKLKDEIVHQKQLNEKHHGKNGYTYTPSQEEIQDAEREARVDKMLKKGCLQLFLMMVLPFFIILTVFTGFLYHYMDSHGYLKDPMETGYYTYEDTTYYYDDDHDDWYYYDNDYEVWERTYESDPKVQAIEEDYDSYYTTDTWDSSMMFPPATDSPVYEDTQEEHRQSYQNSHSDNDNSWNDNDSDYDWGNDDSWDSDDTDWDSDW